MKPDKPAPAPNDESVREHVYDGISEYNRRLPNWWLMTFYATIVFAILYWMSRQQFSTATDQALVEQKMARIEAARLASSGAPLDDEGLQAMSRNAVVVAAGRTTFQTTCASCHGVNLTGGVGPSLIDNIWIHGAQPTQVLSTVTNGVLAKGMPAWGPVLGTRKTSEVVAFVLSQQPTQMAAQ